MAINENIEGRNVFDPSKRIRAALGPEFTSNLQAEAANRLAAAMASTGVIRSPGELTLNEEEENNMNFKGMIGKITHTNPISPDKAVQNAVVSGKVEEPNPMAQMNPEERAKVRGQGFISSERKVHEMFEKKPFIENAIRSTTGFGLSDDSTDNAAHAIALGVKNFAALAVSDAMETTFRLKDNKKVAISAGISSVVNLATTTWASGNGSRVNKIFDPDVITSTEASNISKSIAKEKFKYGLQHTVASVIAPAVVKSGLDKVLGDKTEKNAVTKALTSFGALSEIGKISLFALRKISEKKAVKKFSENGVSVTDSLDKPLNAYNDVAKLAVNRMINEAIDDTVVGTVLGSVIGYRSVEYIPEPAQNSTARKLNAYVASVESANAVEAKAPAATSTSSKKSA